MGIVQTLLILFPRLRADVDIESSSVYFTALDHNNKYAVFSVGVFIESPGRGLLATWGLLKWSTGQLLPEEPVYILYFS
jgi:hypothetical protein